VAPPPALSRFGRDASDAKPEALSGGTLQRAYRSLARVFSPRGQKAAAGGNYWLPISGGWLPPDAPWNFFQLGWDPLPMGQGSIVSACVAAYAQTTAMCPGTHWRGLANNGRVRVANSDLSRILKRPNSYQSTSDFFLNLVTALYQYGNAYALAVRNNRYEIAEVHLMDPRISQPRVAVDGTVFYALAGNPIIEKQIPAEILTATPARDVMHVKLHLNPANRLLGESPLVAAMLDIAASDVLVRQALTYVQNQGRPSGILYTDAVNADQINQTRALWNELTRGPNVGNTVVMGKNAKWEPTAANSRDEQIAELLQISDQRIATAFRMPLALLSLATGQVPSGSTENLMQFWISTGLGFALNHIEDAMSRFFGLGGWPDDYLELDTEALERSQLKDRIDALARGVQGGIYSPNEARAKEDLPAAEEGDEPRVQQQVVPLSAWDKAPAAPPAPPAPAAPPAPTSQESNAAFSAAITVAADRYGQRDAA
jgi:HK97 family phage portal protein